MEDEGRPEAIHMVVVASSSSNPHDAFQVTSDSFGMCMSYSSLIGYLRVQAMNTSVRDQNTNIIPNLLEGLKPEVGGFLMPVYTLLYLCCTM